MKTDYPVIVIGGGQAGLSMSYCLKEQGIVHLVLEKNRIGESWRSQRWDTFCLVTPNWQCQLPGHPYQGTDPLGFMVKDDIVRYIESYAASFQPPVLEGVLVMEVTKSEVGTYNLATNRGAYTANQVVVAVGNYHYAMLPALASRFPSSLFQVHSSEYKNPSQFPAGEVLVVGSGQSGAQIAEDLHLAGKKVHLCVGNAPRTARRYRGKDVVEWLHDMGYYDLSIEEHPDKENVRDKTNHYVTGRDGGRDIDLRLFAMQGMKLYGTLKNIDTNKLQFAPDLEKNLDSADATSANIKKRIDEYINKNGISASYELPYTPVWRPEKETETLDLTSTHITSIVWSIGFAHDFNWIKLPVLDERGFPKHQRGMTELDGLYFLGLTWQYTWGSARFSGVGRDAQFLANAILEQLKREEGALKS